MTEKLTLKRQLTKQLSASLSAGSNQSVQLVPDVVPDAPSRTSSANSLRVNALKVPAEQEIDLLMAFDCTGGMRQFYNNTILGDSFKQQIRSLFVQYPKLAIGCIVHEDSGEVYKIAVKDFVDNADKLIHWLDGANDQNNWEETNNLVIQNMSRDFSWRPGIFNERLVIFFSDVLPHDVYYYLKGSPDNDITDWKGTSDVMQALGIRLYAGQVYTNPHSTDFWREWLRITNGNHVLLENNHAAAPHLPAGAIANAFGVTQFEKYEENLVAVGQVGINYNQLFEGLRPEGARPARPAAIYPVQQPVQQAQFHVPVQQGRGVKRPAPRPANGAAKKRKTTPVAKRKIATAKRLAQIPAAVVAPKPKMQVLAPRMRREDATNVELTRHFQKSKAIWSPWKLAASKEKIENKTSTKHTYRRRLVSGAKPTRINLYWYKFLLKKYRTPVTHYLFEVALERPSPYRVRQFPREQRTVVYCGVQQANKMSTAPKLDQILYSRAARNLLTDFLFKRDGKKVWIRTCSLNLPGKTRQDILSDLGQRWNYAWCGLNGHNKHKPRTLVARSRDAKMVLSTYQPKNFGKFD